MFFGNEFIPLSVKLADTKSYVTIDPTGVPQLIRIEPMFSPSGELIPQSVYLYVDDASTMIDRGTAEAYVSSVPCVPLETVSQHKHRTVH